MSTGPADPIVVEQSEKELLRLFGDAKLAKTAKAGRMTSELVGALREARDTLAPQLSPDEELIQAAKARRRLEAAAAETLGLDEGFFDSTTKLTPKQLKTKARNRRRDAITKRINRTKRRKKKK